MPSEIHTTRTAARGLLRLLWRQPLWAVPFALFFGLLNSRGNDTSIYLLAYKVSLVFSYTIGLGIWAVDNLVAPRLRTCPPDLATGPNWRIGAAYVSSALASSYVAAFIVHLWILPGFLGTPRAMLISGLFTLIFSLLFTGISLATVYYQQALDRARAVETMRAELAQAELRALRAQINPHFLFNTLNSIAALIRSDPAAAEETTTRLADVFRHALRSSGGMPARFGDELAFLRQVLAIERTRFGHRLRVSESIEPGLDDLEVPTMLLQPLVENAVRYAVAPRAEGGAIHLEARRDGDLVRIVIRDDGPGMGHEHSGNGTGFGLHSVRERLRAAGPPHALEVRSEPGQGTEIEITLPARRHESSPASNTKGVSS